MSKFQISRRNVISSGLALALGLGVAATVQGEAQAQGAAPIVIKFSHVVAPNTPKGKGADKFKELAEKYTEGKVKIEVFPNSQLYKDKEEMEALQLGAVQMLAPSLAKFGPLGAREFEVFDLPFLFKDTAALQKVTNGPIGKELFAKLDSKGITGLAYWDNGFKVYSANKPINNPTDMQGLKIRIQSSKVLDAQVRATGSIPQVMAFSEVYQALQTGVVDGQENAPSNVFTQKMHEVQKNIILSNHGYLGYAVIVNKKFWDAIPADTRAKLDKAMAEATAYSNEVANKENVDALAAMKASGKTTISDLTADQRKAWVKAMIPVHKDMESRIGKELIERVYKEVGFVAPTN
jgi:C4-dicarboxylate-binding protein DctP